MQTKEEYKRFFRQMEFLQIKEGLELWEMRAIGVHAFDAIMVKKLFEVDEVAELYPAILWNIKKEYRDKGWV